MPEVLRLSHRHALLELTNLQRHQYRPVPRLEVVQRTKLIQPVQLRNSAALIQNFQSCQHRRKTVPDCSSTHLPVHTTAAALQRAPEQVQVLAQKSLQQPASALLLQYGRQTTGQLPFPTPLPASPTLPG